MLMIYYPRCDHHNFPQRLLRLLRPSLPETCSLSRNQGPWYKPRAKWSTHRKCTNREIIRQNVPFPGTPFSHNYHLVNIISSEFGNLTRATSTHKHTRLLWYKQKNQNKSVLTEYYPPSDGQLRTFSRAIYRHMAYFVIMPALDSCQEVTKRNTGLL